MRRFPALLTIICALAAVAPSADARARPAIGPADWPTYGHDVHRTFHGRTALTPASVRQLAPAWFFRTGDAVTANPIVVGATVYVGSWDGRFYAVDARTGRPLWQFTLDSQPAVSPRPGEPRDITSDGGMVTSSAFFQPGSGGRPDLVLFGGGYTLYALVARTGRLYWKRAYRGRPEQPPEPARDRARIFSSPAVVGDLVVFGVTSDGQSGHRGYIVGADLSTGGRRWTFETDVDTQGRLRNDGCGGVWSSPTVIERLRLVVFDVADCDFTDRSPFDERVMALHVDSGRLAWLFKPPRPDPSCDWDFGATANLGTSPDGRPTFLGVGGKDGTYYSLDPATGRLRWRRNVVFGGFAGGFIATTAFDGHRVYGATALGDFGRFGGFGSVGCQLGNPRDLPLQEPSMHAIDGATGQVAWQQPLSHSFGPTTVAGGMTFVGTTLTRQLQIRSAGDGQLLTSIPLLAASSSGVITVGDALVIGTGSSEQGSPDGVYALTPLGRPPQL